MTLLSLNEQLGSEALTIGEHIKLFFSELSLGIDQFNATYFNSSIHVVPTYNIFQYLKDKNNFITYNANQIATPVFFNPKKTTFREYVSICLQAISLLTITSEELTRSYKAVKTCAANGKLPYSIRQFDYKKAVDEIRERADKIYDNTGTYSRPINQVYPNLSEAESIYKYYNDQVKLLQSRDVEIVSKKVNEYISILQILKRKIDNSEIKISQDDLITIELITQRLNIMVSLTGKLMSTLNDLCRHLEIQVDNFKTYL